MSYLQALSFGAAAFLILGVLWRIGVVPTRGFRLMRRRDNPEAFDVAMTVLFVVIGGLVVAMLFTTWADHNSAKLVQAAGSAAP